MEEQLYRKFYEIETTHWWFSARQRIVADIIENRLALPRDAKVLDVGCGTGAILAMLSRRFEAYGTDTSELAIELCRKRGIANVLRCTLETFPHPDLRFDLITLFDVIEHIDDDTEILRQAYQLLKPGGIVFVTVPAYQFLWGQHDIVNHHKRRYVKSHLKRVLRTSGFGITMCSYYNTILFPAALVGRITDRFIKNRTDTTLDVPFRFLNSALEAVFGFERFLLRRFSLPFGLSLIALARKTE